MFEKEAKLPEGERMDFVTIVTPNFTRFDPAIIALDKGFHMVIDEPIIFTLDEAPKLKQKSDQTGLVLALSFTLYS
jgi:predicted dehydrogenase